jgi:hypothetical protein
MNAFHEYPREELESFMVRIDRYSVVARFARLFPDPAVFEDQEHLAERYLVQNGLPKEKAFYLYQPEDELNPVDDSGKQAIASISGQEHHGRIHAER